MGRIDEIRARCEQDNKIRAGDLKTRDIAQIRSDRKRLLVEVGRRQAIINKQSLAFGTLVIERDARIAELERELAKAVGDIDHACITCLYQGDADERCSHCACDSDNWNVDEDCWEWRGPEE